MRRRRILAAAAGTLLLAAVPANALSPRDWTVATGASEIRFVYSIDGRPSEGVFRRFSGGGRFDPSCPERTEMRLSIDTVSIDLGSRLVSAYATGPEWFDSRSHPRVTYRLTGLAPLGGDRYAATGEIALLGRREVLETEMTLVEGPEGATARGELVVDRRDFGLGVGLSDLIVDVGAEVRVAFTLVARPSVP